MHNATARRERSRSNAALSTQQQRDEASDTVERLMDAGLTYAEAAAAVRRTRGAGDRYEPRRGRAFRTA